jgi:hypothetical protein
MAWTEPTENQSLVVAVRLISHPIEPNGSMRTPLRALIGGAQPNHGWWAPVAALYKEVGAGAHSTRFTAKPLAPPTPQI